MTSIPIDPVTNLNLVLANTVSAPLHTHQTTRPTTCALVCCCVTCLPHTSSLSPRRASAILAKISWGAHPHHLRPHCRSISHTRPMPSSTHLSGPLTSSPNHVLLAFPLTRLRFSGSLLRSPSISPSGIFRRLQLHLQHNFMDDHSTRAPLTSSSHGYPS